MEKALGSKEPSVRAVPQEVNEAKLERDELTDSLMETLLHETQERARVERRHADYLRTANARIQAILDLIGGV